MLKARSAGGLDASERTELLHAADGFDDASKQRLLSHLSAMGQTNAWVNVESSGRVVRVEGRYASLGVGVRTVSDSTAEFRPGVCPRGVRPQAPQRARGAG